MMQLYGFVDGPEAVRRMLITSAFGAWHGFVTEPRYYGPLVHGSTVSGAYLAVDTNHWDDFLARVKEAPRISGVFIKEAVRAAAAERITTGAESRNSAR